MSLLDHRFLNSEEWTEENVVKWIAWTNLVCSVFIFVILYWWIPSPYGKLSNHVWWHGPRYPARWAWCLFESPNLLWATYCANQVSSLSELAPSNRYLFVFFVLHYLQRTIYYPLNMSPHARPVPLLVVVSALIFCTGNGYIQCRSLLSLQTFPSNWEQSWQFQWGLALAVMGMALNLASDARLRQLQRQRYSKQRTTTSTTTNTAPKSPYIIPRGGLFDYCSTPHFLGEVLEWIGFAVACQGSWPAMSFAVYTAANLVPRSVAQHAWYIQYFGSDYPEQRTAFVPFLF